MPGDTERAGRVWRVSERERTLPFPCDAYLVEPDDVYFRGIDIQAPAGVVFRWLCQLRIAPYSYDWIDNLGRRSPRELTPGLERLEVGQRVMTIFELVEFESGRQLTIRLGRAGVLFGEVAVSYLLVANRLGGLPVARQGPDAPLPAAARPAAASRRDAVAGPGDDAKATAHHQAACGGTGARGGLVDPRRVAGRAYAHGHGRPLTRFRPHRARLRPSPCGFPPELPGIAPRVGGNRAGSSAVSEQHERLLRRAYEAFNARDIQGALATMHPQVDWPNAMEGGRVHGHAEVREYWERQWRSLDPRVQPLGIEQGRDGRMVAMVRQLVRDLAGNVLSDETVEHRYAIVEGLIERMDIHDHWRIRDAGEEDIAAVLALWEAAGSLPSVSDSPEGLARLLAADPQALLVAELDGILVGSLIAAWDGWRGSFYRLAVSPEHRRRGLAKMLLREGERRLRERGAARLTAIVADDEADAIAFWRATGYEHQRHRARFVRRPDA
jgi:ribosomal protein S18 acetylase RimI-like enzyme